MLIVKFDLRSLTPFICFSSNIIATTLVITNVNIARLPLFSQSGMFLGATAFNQNIGGWDVNSGTHFVSPLLILLQSLSVICLLAACLISARCLSKPIKV